MREVRYTARFKRDYRREKSGRHGKRLDALLMEVVNLLADASVHFSTNRLPPPETGSNGRRGYCGSPRAAPPAPPWREAKLSHAVSQIS